MSEPQTRLTVICPVFNEADCLTSFHKELAGILETLGYDWNIVYVDDGSTDKSCQFIEAFRADDQRVGLIRLTRNFGKESALLAGLDHCDADLYITMDADGQHPPADIPRLIEHCTEDVDVVFAVRRQRSDDTRLKNLGAKGFYGLMGRFGKVDMPRNASDFRVVRRPVVEAFRSLREAHRFNRALFAWLGFKQVAVPFDPLDRPAGESKWGMFKLTAYGVDGLVSFSVLPLRVALFTGGAVAIGSFLYGFYIVFKTLLFGDPVPGFPSLMVIILFLAGLQLLALGVIGEYVGRTFQEAKNRPLYLVKTLKVGPPGGD